MCGGFHFSIPGNFNHATRPLPEWCTIDALHADLVGDGSRIAHFASLLTRSHSATALIPRGARGPRAPFLGSEPFDRRPGRREIHEKALGRPEDVSRGAFAHQRREEARAKAAARSCEDEKKVKHVEATRGDEGILGMSWRISGPKIGTISNKDAESSRSPQRRSVRAGDDLDVRYRYAKEDRDGRGGGGRGCPPPSCPPASKGNFHPVSFPFKRRLEPGTMPHWIPFEDVRGSDGAGRLDARRNLSHDFTSDVPKLLVPWTWIRRSGDAGPGEEEKELALRRRGSMIRTSGYERKQRWEASGGRWTSVDLRSLGTHVSKTTRPRFLRASPTILRNAFLFE